MTISRENFGSNTSARVFRLKNTRTYFKNATKKYLLEITF